MRLHCISFIAAYQRLLSPDHGCMRVRHISGYCRYYPTCSEYAKYAVMKYGSIRGLLKGMVRIARCNPWSSGGIDFMI